MKERKGYVIVHQHDTDVYCAEYQRDFPDGRPCRYEWSLGYRIGHALGGFAYRLTHWYWR